HHEEWLAEVTTSFLHRPNISFLIGNSSCRYRLLLLSLNKLILYNTMSMIARIYIYTIERDDDVLEYYDQSSRIPLSYRAKSGRRTTQWHTPDFFVLRLYWLLSTSVREKGHLAMILILFLSVRWDSAIDRG